MDKEKIAVAAVMKAISQTDYLTSFINSEDKEPSWDGAIYVYNHAGDHHRKDDLAGRVAVQVKGHESANTIQDSISFNVDVADLRNYLIDGGTVYFVVYFDSNGENETIYYASLLPYNLKALIQSANEQQSKAIRLRPFPVDKIKKAEILTNFVKDRQKQLPAINADSVTLENLIQDGSLKSLSFSYTKIGDKPFTVLDWMLSGDEIYLYAKLAHGIELPVDHITDIITAGETIAKDVSIQRNVYYHEYTVSQSKSGIKELIIGKSISMTIDDIKGSTKFNYSLKGTLNERINAVNFLLGIFEYKTINIGEVQLDLHSIEGKQTGESQKKILDGLIKCRTALDKLGYNEDLNFDEFNETEFRNLNLIIASVCDEKAIPLNDAGLPLGIFNFGSAKILVVTLKDETSEKFRIYSIFDAPIKWKATLNDKVVEVPSCMLLRRDTLSTCSNIINEKILEQLENIDNYDEIAECTVLFLLEVIHAYDMVESTQLLNLAKSIVELIKKRDTVTPYEITRLNELQIVKRQRDFTIDEQYELFELVNDSKDGTPIQIGAYILLGNLERAKIGLSALPEAQMKEFEGYPIYKFMKAEDKTNG